MLVTVGTVAALTLIVVLALTTEASLFEAFMAVFVGLLLYSFAVLAVSYPLAQLLGFDRDALFTAIFFGVPGLFAALVVLSLLLRLLRR